MNSFLPKTFTKFLFIAVLFLGQQLVGQVNMSTTNSHTQNFNTLALSGTLNSWTDNSTIANWYSQRSGSGTTYEASNGGATAGNQYSYGANSNSERALGSLGSGNAAAGNFAHGVLLRNTSGSTLTNLTVTYSLEEWRKSGVTTAQSITFYYRTSSSTITALNPNVNTGWTQVTALTLNSPVNTATGVALDGNLPANRVTATNISIPSLSLANNDYIMLKWEDPDHTGSDHGLAIDDVTINWTVAPAGPTVTTTSNAGLIDPTEAFLTGTINANGTATSASFEYGTSLTYGFTATATPASVTGTTTTDVDAFITSLSLNTQYFYRAVGTVSGTPTNGLGLTFYTLAATPGVLVVSNPLQTTLDVTVNATTENANPSTTEYAIQETGGQYVQANGTLGATEVWQTAAVWGTKTVTGLATSTTYTFSAKARNGANVETGLGGTTSGTTLAVQLVDYAVVQFPNTTQNITEGGSLTVYTRAYEPGLTTLLGSQSNLFAWVGYSSTNDDPANPGWTWVASTFNTEYGNDDEYQATLSGLPVGTYYYAARFQIGTGPYVYGGSGGNWSSNNVTLNIIADVVDYANIQFPTTATLTEGNTVTVYAQVFEPGVTPGAGAGAGITAEIGYSASNTIPDGTWTWLATTYNTDSGNNDEYQADLGTGLAPGTYYYASRFIKTGSSTYVYGGTNGSPWATSGVLTVNALGTPTATAGTSVGLTTFTTNWDAVTDATSYRLDVSTSPTFTEVAVSLAEWTFPIDGTIVTPDVSTPNNSTKTLTTNGGAITSSSADITQSASANQWQSGNGTKYWQIDFDATGFYNIQLSSAQRSSNTGPKNFKVQYKVGASSWTDTGTDIVVANNFTTGVTSLTLPSACDNQGDVSVRWIMTSDTSVNNATVASGGTSRIDQIILTSVTSGAYVIGYEDLNVGSVTSYEVSGLDPETTYHYRVRAVLGAVTSPNSNVIDVTTAAGTCTWDGSAWSNTTGPTFEIEAILEGTYDTNTEGGFTAKKLTVNTGGSLTIGADTSVTVVNELINNLTATAVVIENDGSLIQEGSTNNNSGDVTVFRNSQDLMRLDYTMWSSPVAVQNLATFSPSTLANRFYTYATATDVYTAIANTNDFAVGQGYLIRTPDNHPTSPSSWSGQFIGFPNSGDVPVTLSTAGSGYNLVGNPYPSPISISTLLSENSTVIAGNLYFWRKTNAAAGSAYISYSGGTFSDGAHAFDNIQPGQGFIVEAISASDLTFTNTQRQAGNGVFYRNANTTLSENNSRIWLNVSTNNTVVGQMAVGYNATASNDIDASDAAYINDSAVALNSFVANTELAVQHRATFVPTDVVSLSFKTTTAGSYTIAINDLDGLFDNVEQNIFLKDNLLNVELDLRSAPYVFTTDAGSFTNRFEIVYQSTLSVNNPILANDVIVFTQNNSIEIKTTNENIANVNVFDLKGSLLASQANVNTTAASISLSNVAQQVLIVKITTQNGQTVVRKVIL